MLLSACLVFTLSILYLIFSQRNKIEYVILLYMISISLLMTISAVYIYKLTSYQFSSFGDFELYQLISQMRLSLSDIARLQNISIALLMLSSLMILFLLSHFRKPLLLLVLPILFFLVVNDPAFTWKLYLRSYAESASRINRFVAFSRWSSVFLFFAYASMPLVMFLHSAWKTKIRVRRKDCLIHFLSFFLLNFFVFITFFVGPFKSVLFNNVDLMKFPLVPLDSLPEYIFSPYNIIFISLIVTLLTIIFKPFKEWGYVSRKELNYNAQQVRQNLRMTLHTYKNSFLGVQRMTDLLKQYLAAGESEKALSCIEMLEKISSDNLKDISHTVNLMKNIKLKYSTVDIIDCLESALKSSCLSDDIHIVRHYGDAEKNHPRTLGDASHLQESFVNLFTNAEHALKLKKESAPEITIRIVSESDIYSIEIADNGCGIEKKQLQNIFKFYYSTNSSNISYGIGLSYVDAVIRQHRGSITVTSEENEYTSFQIVLPRIKPKKQKRKEQVNL